MPEPRSTGGRARRAAGATAAPGAGAPTPAGPQSRKGRRGIGGAAPAQRRPQAGVEALHTERHPQPPGRGPGRIAGGDVFGVGLDGDLGARREERLERLQEPLEALPPSSDGVPPPMNTVSRPRTPKRSRSRSHSADTRRDEAVEQALPVRRRPRGRRDGRRSAAGAPGAAHRHRVKLAVVAALGAERHVDVEVARGGGGVPPPPPRAGRRAHPLSLPSESSSSTARKASWGTSTMPICFMRFLPSFCFSRSLRLRLMSPP